MNQLEKDTRSHRKTYEAMVRVARIKICLVRFLVGAVNHDLEIVIIRAIGKDLGVPNDCRGLGASDGKPGFLSRGIPNGLNFVRLDDVVLVYNIGVEALSVTCRSGVLLKMPAVRLKKIIWRDCLTYPEDNANMVLGEWNCDDCDGSLVGAWEGDFFEGRLQVCRHVKNFGRRE